MSRPGPLRHLASASLSNASNPNDSQTASRNSPASQLRHGKTTSVSLFRKRCFDNHGHSSKARTVRKNSRALNDRENQARRKALPKVSPEPRMPSSKTLFQNTNGTEQIVLGRMKRSITDSHIRCASRRYVVSTASPLTQLLNPLQRNVPEPPARMLITVSVLGGIQASRLIVTVDATVMDVTREVLKACEKDGRLPSGGSDADFYELHYSEFFLESLDPDDAVINLGARSFVLCPKRQHHNNPSSSNPSSLFFSSTSCSSSASSSSYSSSPRETSSCSSSVSSSCSTSSSCLPAALLICPARKAVKPWWNMLGLVSA